MCCNWCDVITEGVVICLGLRHVRMTKKIQIILSLIERNGGYSFDILHWTENECNLPSEYCLGSPSAGNGTCETNVIHRTIW